MMNSLHKVLLKARETSKNDDQLINEINQLAAKHGAILLQTAFHILAGLELTSQTAETYWRELLLHRRKMIRSLGREIDLVPCIYDFLSTTEHFLDKPRLIEEKSYEQVILETTHDNLTTLFNRQYLKKTLEQTFYSAKRYNNDLSLLFLDIDNFKEFNDTFGHAFGDEVLRQVARIITEQKRDSDIAARYGGEEFIVLMPETESINGFILAERIRKNIAAYFQKQEEGNMEVTVSGGLASYPQNCNSETELLSKADSALYLAKGAGKNRISLYKQEKRRYLRVSYHEPVKIKELGFDFSPVFSGTSKDICIGGILFENPSPLPIGSKIQVSLPIEEGNPLLLIGTVVRVEAFEDGRYDIGMTISFKEMEKIASTKIANFLKGE